MPLGVYLCADVSRYLVQIVLSGRRENHHVSVPISHRDYQMMTKGLKKIAINKMSILASNTSQIATGSLFIDWV